MIVFSILTEPPLAKNQKTALPFMLRCWSQSKFRLPVDECVKNWINLNSLIFNIKSISKGVGASDNPCSETHAGPVAFSDPESTALKAFYEERKDEIQVYLAFHSYGQYILSPWGYTYDHVHNYDQLMQIGDNFNFISNRNNYYEM